MGSRRAGGRHAQQTAARTRDTVSDALNALWGMDPDSARTLLEAIPTGTTARQVLPAVEALWFIVAERSRLAAEPPGPAMSPACGAGYCWEGIPCYVAGCAHKCHRQSGAAGSR